MNVSCSLCALVLCAVVGCNGSSSPTAPTSTQPPASLKWRPDVASGTFTAVWGSSQADVFATGGQINSGSVLHFDGIGWKQSFTGKDAVEFHGIAGTSHQNVFAVGSIAAYGAIYHYDGSSWSQTVYPASGSQLLAVSLGSDTTGIAVGAQGVVLHYDGSSWKQLADAPGGSLAYFAAWCANTGEAFIGTAGGIIYIYKPTIPSQWTRFDLPHGSVFGIWGESPTSVFAVADSGAIHYFNGNSWAEMSSGTHQALRGIWGTSYSDVYAVGDGGTILHFDGATWAQMNSNTAATLMGVWLPPTGDPIVVGQTGIYRRSEYPLLQSPTIGIAHGPQP